MNKELLDILQALSYVVVILGLPLAFVQYKITKRREKRDREYGTYNASDEKYLEYQKLCLQYPYLNIFDVPDTGFGYRIKRCNNTLITLKIFNTMVL